MITWRVGGRGAHEHATVDRESAVRSAAGDSGAILVVGHVGTATQLLGAPFTQLVAGGWWMVGGAMDGWW